MTKFRLRMSVSVLALGLLPALPAAADVVFFNTGTPDGKIATASRPESTGKFEIESADDFILSSRTLITDATFTGLLTGGATISDIGQVRVEMYRIFPNDSNTMRMPQVPTRMNSPSDVEFADRDTASGNLNFTTTDLGPFTAANSVQPGGISVGTMGNGQISGEEVMFSIDFTTPFDLPADHYFFVPQVEITSPDGEFFWLSAPRPITGGTGPFVGDLQSWTRDAMLDPDWLRVGTDIVDGSPVMTFNGAFSLSTLPEPASLTVLGAALAGLVAARRRCTRSRPSS